MLLQLILRKQNFVFDKTKQINLFQANVPLIEKPGGWDLLFTHLLSKNQLPGLSVIRTLA